MTTTTVPISIGIILDGNRRYAREKNIPQLEGHRAGLDKVREVIRWAKEVGVKNLIVYALSTENLKRTEEEVSHLFKLIRLSLRDFMTDFKKEGGVLKCVGDLALLPLDIQKLITKTEAETMDNEGIHFYIALAYGGRVEIVRTVQRIVAQQLEPEEITEALIAKNLFTYPMPDPDIIIRTGGEQRLSGFLPWQSVYSELFFTKTYWPAFSKQEFFAILDEFSKRKRNFGK